MDGKKNSARTYDLAFKDKLTGTWNMNGFEETGRAVLEAHPSTSFAVIALDLVNFSVINEHYGRKMGNKVIVNIYNVLKRYEDEDTVIGHVHADHFMLLTKYSSNHELLSYVNDIMLELSACEIDKKMFNFEIKVGICPIDTGKREEIESYVDKARIAYKQAKAEKGTKMIFFDEELRAMLTNEYEIVQGVSNAIKNSDFRVYFQPKFDIRTDEIIGAEALIRWEHDEKGLLGPDEFIPILEKNGLMTEVDFLVLETVCQHIQKRMQEGKKVLPISVNQSRANFSQLDYAVKLQSMLIKYDIPKGAVEIEIKEAVMNDLHESTLLAMQEMGCLVSVDDFGTGYSMTYILNKSKVDMLKIDKSLLEGALEKQKFSVIMEKTVQLALALDIDVLCQGVENLEQVEFLKKIGCYKAQGYYYSKPLLEEEYRNLLEADK